MKDRAKTFDAVRKMREIRAALNREMADMGHEEQKRYMEERLRKSMDRRVR